MSRPLRVLHIGNIANNAYNIVKALRERTDIEADCYTNHYKHYISQPEWEDADIGAVPCNDSEPVAWHTVDLKGFKRPAWYFETRTEAVDRACSLPAKDCLRFLGLVQTAPVPEARVRHWREMADAAAAGGNAHREDLLRLAQGRAPLEDDTFPTRKAWERHLRTEFRRLCVPPHTELYPSDFLNVPRNGLSEFFKEYDIIQAYGAGELIYPLLHAPAVPRVTFEHGTMRDFPFQTSTLGRTTMLAYKTAFANIITNADAIHNARRMGLDNAVFIPHPVDDTKFRPAPDAAFRNALLAEHDATYICLALARQNWAIKGNDRVLRGFADFIRKAGPGPKLFLGAWGQEVERTRQLMRQLHLQEHVVWLPPLPKRLLARYINAADVVLDQFVLGAFGTTTPEALACAKPVLLYYNHADHEWCLNEPPPVCNVRTESEICDALLKLYEGRTLYESLAARSHLWFKQYHSIDLVIQRHTDIYKKIASSRQHIRMPVRCYTQTPIDEEILCIVTCAAKNATEALHYLHGIHGKSVLEIFDTRIRKAAPRAHVVLLLATPLPELQDVAARLGWTTFITAEQCRSIIKKCGFRFLSALFCTKFVWRCALEYPFIMAEETARWHRHFMSAATIVSGTASPHNNPYVPQGIYSRAYCSMYVTMKGLFRSHFDKWQCISILTRYGVQIKPPVLDAPLPRVGIHNVEALAEHLDPAEFSMADVRGLIMP